MAQVTITAKVRICPDDDTQRLLLDTMHAYNSACNEIAEYISATHILSKTQLSKDLYRQLRANYGLGAQMAQSAIRTTVAKYKGILKNEGKWIQPTFKKPVCELVWNRDYSFSKGLFSLGTVKGRIKVGFFAAGVEKYLQSPARYGTATLLTRHGKWYLHVPVTLEVPDVPNSSISNVVGVDLGINFHAVSFDSAGKVAFYHGRQAKRKRAHYQQLRKQLQHRQTPSARRRMRAIGQRENRWMRDVNHCVSKALVESQPQGTLLVLEDLTGIRSVTEKVRLYDRYTQVSWAFYDLRCKLEYKAALHGSKVIIVPPQYTSQTCPCCGHVEARNRNKQKHRFVCRQCGYRSNDDRVAAMNLQHKGIEYLASA